MKGFGLGVQNLGFRGQGFRVWGGCCPITDNQMEKNMRKEMEARVFKVQEGTLNPYLGFSRVLLRRLATGKGYIGGYIGVI